MKIKRIISLCFICLVASFCVLIGACTQESNNSNNDNSNKQQLTTSVINKTQLTLEKHETYQLSVEGNDTYVWTSTDASVACVSIDGTVTAVTEGMAIIKATSETSEAKCIVQVTDNELVPKIVTSIGSSELALIKGDDFSFEYNVYYNKKIIDVDIDIRREGDDNVITLENDKIIEIIKKNVPQEVEISSEMRLREDLGLTSLSMFALIFDMEQLLGHSLELVSFQQAITVGDFMIALQKEAEKWESR